LIAQLYQDAGVCTWPVSPVRMAIAGQLFFSRNQTDALHNGISGLCPKATMGSYRSVNSILHIGFGELRIYLGYLISFCNHFTRKGVYHCMTPLFWIGKSPDI
jgi:hypothetical protein